MQYYTKSPDGKFVPAVHPDTAKLAEFRQTNLGLMRDNDALTAKVAALQSELAEDDAAADAADAADAAAVAATQEKLTDLESQLSAANAKLAASAALETQLSAERTAHAATQFKNTIGHEFLRAGGRANALDFIVSQAASVFTIQDGQITTKEFSAENPAAPLTVGEWMLQQTIAADYAFLPSRGGGARSTPPSVLGARKANELVNPSPQQLGEYASDIRAGKVKVVLTT